MLYQSLIVMVEVPTRYAYVRLRLRCLWASL